MRNLFCTFVCLSFTLSACSKKESPAGGETGAAKAPATAKAPAAAPASVKLGKLPLHADLPPGATVSDGITPDSVMIMGGAVGAMSVGIPGSTDPVTLEAAKEEIKMLTPANVKAETLADGWLLTFDNKGSLGANFMVRSVRKIAGKEYSCETTASAASQQAAVAAACKSLRP